MIKFNISLYSRSSKPPKDPKSRIKWAKENGVIYRGSDGKWHIISLRTGEDWKSSYSTREKAESALKAYHINKNR